jgi:Ca2+/Na+ antiporter
MSKESRKEHEKNVVELKKERRYIYLTFFIIFTLFGYGFINLLSYDFLKTVFQFILIIPLIGILFLSKSFSRVIIRERLLFLISFLVIVSVSIYLLFLPILARETWLYCILIYIYYFYMSLSRIIKIKKEKFVIFNNTRHFLKGNQININSNLPFKTPVKNMNELYFPQKVFRYIKTLDLSYNQIAKIEVPEKFEKLEDIYLNHNRIVEISGLENIKDIRVLTLNNNYIQEIKGLDNLKNLESLNLSDNDINQIKGLDNLKKLEHLNLSDNDINQIGGLEKLKSLVSLEINKNHIKRLQGLDCCLNLTGLYLRNNLIESLEGISKLKKLWFLDLSKNNLRNLEGIEMLFNLRHFNAYKNSLPNDPARPKLTFGQKWVKYAQLKNGPKIIDELKLRLNN